MSKRLPASDTILIIVVLALMAIVTQWMVWLQKVEERVDVFTGPPRSEYSLSDFEMRALDDQGQLRFIVQSPRLSRDGRDGAFWVDAPRFEIRDTGNKPWLASANQAWVRGDNDWLELRGAVQIKHHAKANKAVLMQTETLRADIANNQLSGDDAVTVTHADDILRGVGFKADLKTERIQLLKDVHAKLHPTR